MRRRMEGCAVVLRSSRGRCRGAVVKRGCWGRKFLFRDTHLACLRRDRECCGGIRPPFSMSMLKVVLSVYGNWQLCGSSGWKVCAMDRIEDAEFLEIYFSTFCATCDEREVCDYFKILNTLTQKE